MLPGLLVGPSLDAAVFTLTADRLLDGVPPYAGTWDHKPPLIYVLAALAQVLLGWLGPWPATWSLSVVSVAAVGALVAAIVQRMGYARMALACGIAVAVATAQFVVSLGGGLTEHVATVPAAAAILIALRAGGARRWVLVGALGASSVAISLQALPAAAPLAFLALSAARPLRALGSLMAGGLMAAGVVVGALIATGLAAAAVDAVLAYNLAYRAAGASAAALGGPPQVAGVILTFLFLIVPAAFGGIAWRRRAGLARTAGLACMLWVGLAMLMFALQGRFETHYAVPLAVPLAMLAAMGLHEAVEAWRAGWLRRALVSAPLALGAVLAGGVIAQTAPPMIQSVAAGNARADRLAPYLQRLAGPEATIFVWGNEPQVYLAAARAPSVRFIYLYPLTTPGYTSPRLIDDVLAAWRAHPPAVVVDAGSAAPGLAGSLPLLMDRPVVSDGRDYDALDPLRAFVRERYRLEAVIDGWPLYRYIGR